MNTDLNGKKVLILGGAFQHLKLVNTAKEMGVITYVTDYLEEKYSPAKKIADYKYKYNITDIDELVSLCRRENIDGIIAPYLDVVQRPYQVLCEKLGYPCFGNKKQFQILTDKRLFKRFCEEHGVDTIPYYMESYILDKSNIEKVEFPILIKPCDSRGSRGQTICYSRKEAIEAIEFAKKESRFGNIVIEKYMENADDLQLVYIVIEGEPILVRVEDRYLGNKKSGLDKLSIASIEPSINEGKYRKIVNEKVISMIRKIGLYNSPVFLQGIMKENRVYFYDPGIRLPGDEYDQIYKVITGIDLTEVMVRFALTGRIRKGIGEKIKNTRIEKATAMIYIAICPGKIKKIKGVNEIKNNPFVLSMSQLYHEGDEIGMYNDVRQRFGEIDIICENFGQLQSTVKWLYDTLQVIDVNNRNMIFVRFDTNILEKYML